MIKASHRYGIYLLFICSGFTALVYEILWAKQLSLIFGTSMIAVSIVAATFMGGLALGSSLLGRYSDRHGDWLRMYAILELGIALCALSFPLGLGLIRDSYVDLSAVWPARPLFAHSLQFIQTVILLLMLAALMGGTFPVVCRQFARSKCGAQIGRLYAFNTLGATAGALACGFLLIPKLGISGTNVLAIAVNLSVVAAAWILGGQLGQPETVSPAAQRLPIDRTKRVVLASVALVGFFGLAYEILWTRVLLLFLGNTSYAFSMILSCFLIGIACGGWVYARIAHPGMNETRVFLGFLTAMGVFMLASMPFYDLLAHLFYAIQLFSGERWWLLSLLNWLVVLAIMGVPAMFSGALLPAGVALMNPGRRHTGSGVGMIVSSNTIGAVFGSLCAGFVMVPWLGLQNSFIALGALQALLVAFLVWWFWRQGITYRRALVPIAIGVSVALAMPAWDPGLMNSGVYCYAAKYEEMGGIESVLARERILETIEGRDATVAVHEDRESGVRFFTVNGKTDGGTGSDNTTQLLIGHIPMLLHPGPDAALVIGLGTGITLNGLPDYVTKRIDCVEISPEVVAAQHHFRDASNRALEGPKVRLLINDGRNNLLADNKEYDVIISEPSNPWQSGNANLFTLEFYRLAAQRLRENGVFSQWLGLYDITPENLRMACRTLMEVFPHVLAFRSGSDMILLATKEARAFDYALLEERLREPPRRKILAPLGIDSPGDVIARHFLFGAGSLARFAGTGKLNSDDHPVLEYSARHNLGRSTLGELQARNVRALLAARTREMLPLDISMASSAHRASALEDLGQAFRETGQHPEAEHFLARAREVEAQL